MTSSAQTETARFGAAMSTLADTRAAVDEVIHSAVSQLGAQANLAVVFASQHHREHMSAVAEQICTALGSEALIGCTGESIIGGDREIEGAPAISLWLAALPTTTIRLMHLEAELTHEGSVFTGWPGNLPERWPNGSALLLMGEPFSFPADALLKRINEDQPGVPILGGMASGGMSPRENCLLLGRKIFSSGAVAALISGSVRVRSVVSQGCRPIGKPFVVTRAEENIIYELGGVPPMVRLQEMLPTLTEQERQQIQRGLHVGRVLSEYQDQFQHGDFLVRNVIGGDPRTGAIAIGDYVRIGQTVQFHLRDEFTADEDLRTMLKTAAGKDGSQGAAGATSARGALLFTCNGRGTRLFSSADHDATCVRQTLGEIPVAGFFAQGEIGPVGKENFLHGFTASVAIFEQR